MSWDGNSLRSAPEERTKKIYFSNVGAFFSRGSRNENERKVEKKTVSRRLVLRKGQILLCPWNDQSSFRV